MSENFRRFSRAMFGFDATVARTAADAWANQSPCPEWTAADVVGHNIGMCDMVAGFTQGVGAAAPSDGRPADPMAAWAASRDAMLNALDTRGALQAVAVTPWGELPVDKFLGFAWVDPLIHTWDLAVASGQAPALDAELVADGAVRLERAGDSLRGPGRFGPEVELAADFAIADRFIALSGRDPAAASC